MELTVHQRPEDAGVYRFLGESFHVDDVIDPALVREIRVIDPCYVPLLVKRRYKTPAGTEIVKTYHVIGRYIEHPTEAFADDYIELNSVPRDFPFPRDKVQALRTMWAPWKGPRIDPETGQTLPPDPEWKLGTPPAEVKPGRWLVERLRAVHKFFDVGMVLESDDSGKLQQKQKETVQDRLNEMLNSEKERDEKIMADAMAEARYRARHNWPQLKKAADEERFAPEPPDDRPKPFVDLGGK